MVRRESRRVLAGESPAEAVGRLSLVATGGAAFRFYLLYDKV